MAANDNLGPQFFGEGFEYHPDDDHVSLHNVNMMRHDLKTGALSSGKEVCSNCGTEATHDYLRHRYEPEFPNSGSPEEGVVQKTCNKCGHTEPRQFNWPVSENYYGH